MAWSLVREPYQLSLAQLADLTDEQLDLLFAEKAPHQRQQHSNTPAVQSYRQVFEHVWSKRGLSPVEIESKWIAEGHSNG